MTGSPISQPLFVHLAVAKRYDREYEPLPEPIRVVEVGPKPGWPKIGDWYEFACGGKWLAVPGEFRGDRLADAVDENADWPYTWCQGPVCRNGWRDKHANA